VNNKPEGWGTYYFANGDRYEGEWVDNNRHGKGKLISHKGVYDG